MISYSSPLHKAKEYFLGPFMLETSEYNTLCLRTITRVLTVVYTAIISVSLHF